MRERKTAGGRTVLEFTEMMETLVSAGLSLQESLEMMALPEPGRTGKAGGAAVLAREILASLERGSSFAEAVCGMETVFFPLYRGMIAVGDRAGSVEKILPALAAFLREQKTMRDRISAAFAYPALVLCVAAVLAAVLALFVLPGLENIFSAFSVPGGGGSAETVRRNIAAMKNGALALGMILALAVSASAVFRIAGRHMEAAGIIIDRIVLALPLAGSFVASRETLNFCFAMEALTSGGISLETGLFEAETVLSNRLFRRALETVREAVTGGGSLQEAFLETGVFPPYFCRWIAIGENTGKGEEIFSRMRRWFQGEIEKQCARFLLLVEPVTIALVGALVLILVAAVVLPVFQAYGNLI